MKLKVNSILYTKDGRKIGNALIIATRNSEHIKEKIYDAITDYGNTLSLTKREVKEYYHKDVGKASKDHKHYVKKMITHKFDIKSSSNFHEVQAYAKLNSLELDYYVLGHAHPTYYTTIRCDKEQNKKIKEMLK